MKETFNVLFFIRRTRLLKNGEAAIQMRITVNGQYEELHTKRQVNPKCWNQKKAQATGKSPGLVELNRHLMNLRARAYTVQTELIEEGLPVNALAVKERIFHKKEEPKELPKMFFEEFKAHNDECKSLIGKDYAKSTVDRYCLCLSYFKEMYSKMPEQAEFPQKDIPFNNVSERLIRKFEVFLKTEKNICNNTCIRYLKCVHKIVNIGINNGWIKLNPYANIKLRVEKTHVDFLDMEEINILMNKEFSIKRLEQVRDVFVFCCFTGLAFIDAWQLNHDHLIKDISNGVWIRKKRQKTKIEFCVPLLDIPLSLIEKYKSDPSCEKRNKLLPVISNQKMNGYLKEIADLCGIKKRLTMHLARHTYATTITLNKGVSMESVSKMLGHTKITTTQIYARILNEKVKEEMKLVTESLRNSSVLIPKTSIPYYPFENYGITREVLNNKQANFKEIKPEEIETLAEKPTQIIFASNILQVITDGTKLFTSSYYYGYLLGAKLSINSEMGFFEKPKYEYIDIKDLEELEISELDPQTAA